MTSKSSSWVDLSENNKRRLWQWCLAVLLLVVFPVLTFIIFIMSIDEARYVMNYGANAYNAIRRDVYNYASGFIGASGGVKAVIATLGAALFAFGGFSYLNDRIKLDFYESMPLRKGSRFSVIWLNGFIMYALTYVIGMLLCFAVLTVSGYGDLYTIGEALRDFGNMTLYFLGVYHLFIFSMMITGTSFAGLCAFTVLSGYEAVIRLLIAAYKGFFFRYNYTLEEFMVPVVSPYGLFIKLNTELKKTNGIPTKYIFALGAFDLIMLIASYLVYMKRPREKAGKTLVFKWMAVPLKLIMAVPAVLVVILITAQTMNDNGRLSIRNIMIIAVIALVASVIVCALIQGVFELDVRLAFKKKLQWLICFVIAILIFFGFKKDLMGIDRYVPNPSSVASVVFAPEGYDGFWGNRIDADIKYVDMIDFYRENMYITDVNSVCELAKLSMERYDAAWEIAGDDPDTFYKLDESGGFSQAVVLYRMKNGMLVARELNVPVKDARAAELLDKIMSTDEFVKGYYSVEVYDADKAVKNTLPIQLNARFTDGVHENRLGADELLELIAMYKKDMESFSYKARIDELPAGYIRYSISTDDTGFLELMSAQEESLVIYPDMKNCMKYLNEAGYSFDGYSLADEADAVVITNSHYDEQNAYMEEQGIDFVPDEVIERFVKTREYSGDELKNLEAYLHPSDMGMYRWDGGMDFDYSYEVQVIYKHGGEQSRRYGEYNYYYFIEDEVPENVVKDLAL
ncbi:MAG: hypothetical protein IKP31_04990 [Lachnospiraceae bacterium]|nr:hypothetical protein [Lachnospiraceae bacterium]